MMDHTLDLQYGSIELPVNAITDLPIAVLPFRVIMSGFANRPTVQAPQSQLPHVTPHYG